MEIRDLFVATVAITIGAMMLYTSILNEGWCFEMRIARAIEESRGREKARTFIGAAGSIVMALGLYILIAPWLASNLFHSHNDSSTGTELPSPVAVNAE